MLKSNESIVPYAPSLVKKAKMWCFYTKDIAIFEKKSLNKIIKMHPKLHIPTSNNNEFSFVSLETN